MKKVLLLLSALIGAGFVCDISAQVTMSNRRVRLTNRSGKEQTFWFQFVTQSRLCKNAAITLQANESIRTGNCPLASINTGDKFSTKNLMVDMTSPDWRNAQEVHFYPKGFFPTQRRQIRVILREEDRRNGQRFRRTGARLDITYLPGSACDSGRINFRNLSTRIMSGGDCPIQSIKAVVDEEPVNWGGVSQGSVRSRTIDININNAREGQLYF